MRNWPKVLSITYLGIAMPIRFFISLGIFPHIPVIHPKNNISPDINSLDHIRTSHLGRHVRKIFHEPAEVVTKEE